MRFHPIVFLLSLSLLIHAAPGEAQRFSGKTEVTVIEIPVQVSRDGQPVRGLTQADFEVFDGREEMPITGFEVVDLGASTAGRPAAVPVSARRHFLFLFDLAFSDTAAVIKARESALDIVRSALHPSDLAAVATYSPTQGTAIVLGFTSDRQQVELAIDTLGVTELIDGTPDPLGLVARSLSNDLVDYFTAGGPSGGGGGAGGKGAALADTLRSMVITTNRSDRAQELIKVSNLTRSLADLAQLMRTVDGRKHVVFLSEGFSSQLLTGTEIVDPQAQLRRNVLLETGQTEYADNNARYGDTRAVNELETMLEEFRKANCAIHAVDIGGARAGADVRAESSHTLANKDSLVAMARSTGGEFLENFNDLQAAFSQLLDRTSVTYLLTIQPLDLSADGKYHRLRVRLKSGPRGTTVTHRPGYFAPKTGVEMSAMERRFESAERILSGEPGGQIRTATLAAPLRVPGQAAYVPVLLEIDGKSLLVNATTSTLTLDIYVYALDDSGRVLDYVVQNLGLDLSKVRTALENSGIKFFGHLDLPPGRGEVRVLVESRGTGRFGLEVIPWEVAAANTTTPVLLTPLFPEAPGRWLVIREGEAQQKERNVPYPFVAGDQPFLPAVAARLPAGSTSDLWLMGYNLGGELAIEAQVLTSHDGAPAAGGELTITGRAAGPGGGDQLLGRFDAKNLSPGAYVLRLTVTDTATGLTHMTSSPFAITAAP